MAAALTTSTCSSTTSTNKIPFSQDAKNVSAIMEKVKQGAARALEQLGATKMESSLPMLQRNLSALGENQPQYQMVYSIFKPINDAVNMRNTPIPQNVKHEELMVYHRVFQHALLCITKLAETAPIRTILAETQSKIETQRKVSSEAGQKAELEFKNLLPSFILPAAKEMVTDLASHMPEALTDVEMWQSTKAEFEGMLKDYNTYAPTHLVEAMQKFHANAS